MKFLIWFLSGSITCFFSTTLAVGVAKEILESDAGPIWTIRAVGSFWSLGMILILVIIMLIVQAAWVLLSRTNSQFERSWRSVLLGLLGLTVVTSIVVQVAVGGIGMTDKAIGFFVFGLVWVMLGVGIGLPLARLIVPGLRPGAFSRNPERTG